MTKRARIIYYGSAALAGSTMATISFLLPSGFLHDILIFTLGFVSGGFLESFLTRELQ